MKVTIYIPDRLREQMKQALYSGVNWSVVAQDAFETHMRLIDEVNKVQEQRRANTRTRGA